MPTPMPPGALSLRDAPVPSRPTAGISLVEIVVAVALLSVLTLSTLLTLIPVSRQTRLNREVEAATYAVSDVLERIHATPFSELLTLYPDGTVQAVSTLENGQLAISYEDVTTDPLIMTLALTWQSPEVGSMSRTFRTVRTE
ncbi:MAG: hypothetical protein KDC38_09850 [Planctomycetes bacterium]|nr:hypothetical protein [Planctomycetota bacterium]